jgi:hypothetical protein
MVLETISPQQKNRVHPKGRTMKICISKGQSYNENHYHKLAKEE